MVALQEVRGDLEALRRVLELLGDLGAGLAREDVLELDVQLLLLLDERVPDVDLVRLGDDLLLYPAKFQMYLTV